jgi:hypothetical protein
MSGGRWIVLLHIAAEVGDLSVSHCRQLRRGRTCMVRPAQSAWTAD